MRYIQVTVRHEGAIRLQWTFPQAPIPEHRHRILNDKRANAPLLLHVRDRHPGRSIIDFLADGISALSRGELRKRIRQRMVQLNGNLCLDERQILKSGDVVKVFPWSLAAPPRTEDVRIVFRDPHLVVVDKPSGMTSVRNADDGPRGKRKPASARTLEDRLPEILRRHEQTSVRKRESGARSGRPENRPARSWKGTRVYPVHRLDRETSGLILFALHEGTASRLEAMFAEHRISRTYRAVAIGRVPQMTIDSFMARDRGDGLRGSVPRETAETRRAVTHVAPIRALGDYTLVECRLETGRTHQIRIHLAEQGHMICGEKMYVRRPGEKKTIDRSGAPRLALHACRLEFRHPVTGKNLSFDSPWPADLREWMGRLSRSGKRS